MPLTWDEVVPGLDPRRFHIRNAIDRVSSRADSTAYPTAAGSPGPFDRNTPSGFIASTSRAGVAAGTTLTRQPEERSRRRMPRLMPKS